MEMATRWGSGQVVEDVVGSAELRLGIDDPVLREEQDRTAFGE